MPCATSRVTPMNQPEQKEGPPEPIPPSLLGSDPVLAGLRQVGEAYRKVREDSAHAQTQLEQLQMLHLSTREQNQLLLEEHQLLWAQLAREHQRAARNRERARLL